MALPANHVLPLVFFSSAVFSLCVCQVPSFNVPSHQCVAPTLNYGAATVSPQPESQASLIYTMPPFTSSCSGRVVGYWFCYQNTSSTTGGRVNISTVLLLEDMGANYRTVRSFTVAVIVGGDKYLPGRPSDEQCCVTRNLSAESQFGVNSSYLYGVVDLPVRPNMIQTHVSVGHPGYQFTASEYTRDGDTALRKSGSPTRHPLRMFQFIIDNSTSDSTTTGSTSVPPPTNMPSTSDTSSIPSTLSTSDTDETFSSTRDPTPTNIDNTIDSTTSTTPTTDTSTDSQAPTLTTDTSSSPTGTSSTGSSPEPQPQTSLVVVGVGATLGVLLVMVVVIVVVIVIIVMVMRRRNKDYALQQSTEGPGFMNAVYSGVGATGKAAEASKGSLPSSGATKRNYYTKEPGKNGPYAEPSHEYSMPDEIRPNAVRNQLGEYSYADQPDTTNKPQGRREVPQHYEYAIVSQNQEAPRPPLLGEYSYADQPDTTNMPQGRREFQRSLTAIYMTPARDETSLYAQFRTIRIKQISRDAIKVVDHLGSGQFGTVDRGVWQSPEGDIPVAVKTLNPGVKDEDRVKFLQEAAIMGQFSHSNVVKLYGVVTTDQPMMIVLELLPKGDLRNVLLSMKTDSGEQATPHTLLSYCRQIAAGMCYLSQKSFIHRDLAARNILVAEDGICKVADFGMSRDLADENYYISHGGKIPVKWTAPEALNFKKYSTASDVWSYGALMYEIWSLGHKPFEGYTNVQSMKRVDCGYRLPPPPGCPKTMYELMIQCWHPETSERPTFTAILQTLSLPDSHLLQWSEADKAEHPEAATLGAELEAATDLYPKLQQSYLLDKDYETAD